MSIQAPVLPPNLYSDELQHYLSQLVASIQLEVDATNGVSMRRTIPSKPREGKIYYLEADLNDVATEGFWSFINNEWHKFANIDDATSWGTLNAVAAGIPT